jgi:reverse gyrase
MAKKHVSACIRCDGRVSLSKVGEHHFCQSCLAESRRHVYGNPEPIPASGLRAVMPEPPAKT